MVDYAKYRLKYQETLQKVAPEPLEVVGVLSVSGAGTADALRFVSPLAGSILGRSARKKSGLPKDLLIGVGPTAVIATGYKPSGFGIKLKGDLIVWPRAGLRFTPGGAGWGSKVWVDFLETGQRLELETSPFMGGDFNAPLFAALAAQPGA